MITTTAITAVELAELIDKAAAVIARNGLAKRYLYDTRQADTGLPLDQCRVDIIGALNVAAHGTPRYATSRIVYAAERALEQRIEHASIVTWVDQTGRDADDAIVLLKTVAAELRTEAAI
ncbi:hypothetical protein ABT186_01650 [Streptomyces sp. NPDC001634]|uniref:DUF6197 family protein n=1 Tax=Streptomyces sp. NPDC001634 TaxID=3154390 RepID=UPI00333361EE